MHKRIAPNAAERGYAITKRTIEGYFAILNDFNVLRLLFFEKVLSVSRRETNGVTMTPIPELMRKLKE